jgi:hypothetical protein
MCIDLRAIGIDDCHRLRLPEPQRQCSLAAGRWTGNKRQSFASRPFLRIRHVVSFFHKCCHTDSGRSSRNAGMLSEAADRLLRCRVGAEARASLVRSWASPMICNLKEILKLCVMPCAQASKTSSRRQSFSPPRIAARCCWCRIWTARSSPSNASTSWLTMRESRLKLRRSPSAQCRANWISRARCERRVALLKGLHRDTIQPMYRRTRAPDTWGRHIAEDDAQLGGTWPAGIRRLYRFCG